ncbi:MAG: adenylyltransferase/cytidyltransferase family protein [Nanobdellota archaeon]
MVKTVCVSGYFSILHKGHVRLFVEAKKLGDKLIVIVNNNDQQIRKKGKLIHDANDIKYILEHLEMVDEAIVAIDEDKTVCKTLEKLKPDIFANGGDRNKDNVPENDVCDKYNIKMVYNVGGEKTNSSSKLIKQLGM